MHVFGIVGHLCYLQPLLHCTCLFVCNAIQWRLHKELALTSFPVPILVWPGPATQHKIMGWQNGCIPEAGFVRGREMVSKKSYRGIQRVSFAHRVPVELQNSV